MSDHFHPGHNAARGHHQPQQHQPPPAPQAAPEEAWVMLGRVVAVFGLRGDLKVIPQTDVPNRFAQLQEIFLGPQHLPFRITSARPHKGDMLLLHLKGIDSPEQAQELTGLAIDIPLAHIAPLPPDTYYIHDLLGLRVETPQGQLLGIIKDILPTGGNDVYVVQEQGSLRNVLVPAVKEMVKRVDIAAGVLILDPIPGLFDERFEEAL